MLPWQKSESHERRGASLLFPGTFALVSSHPCCIFTGVEVVKTSRHATNPRPSNSRGHRRVAVYMGPPQVAFLRDDLGIPLDRIAHLVITVPGLLGCSLENVRRKVYGTRMEVRVKISAAFLRVVNKVREVDDDDDDPHSCCLIFKLSPDPQLSSWMHR